MQKYLERFMRHMEDNGCHVTRQRMAIASAFFSMPGHPTMEEVYDTIKESEPGIGLATVYRTLKLLQEAGLALELRFGDKTARFEVVSPERAHTHLVCRACGVVLEVSGRPMERMRHEMTEDYGFAVEDQAHCLHGLCRECRAIGEAPPKPLDIAGAEGWSGARSDYPQ